MLLMFEESALQHYRPRLKKCGNACTVLSVTLCFVTLMTLLAIFAVDLTQRVHIVYIYGIEPQHTTDKRFLSIALDSSIIANGFKDFNFTHPRVIKLMKALSPAYLRIGGTMADRLTFSTSNSLHFKHLSDDLDGGVCSYTHKFCDYLDKPNFTMNAQEWLQLNELARKTGLKLIFDLNVLKRFDNGTWDPTNALELISFSADHNLDVNWELGNEPNSFRHQFNYEVAPADLAKDFQTLRDILDEYPMYSNSLLVGPDVTRPEANHTESQVYLRGFLAGAEHVIDAITWHQYYFNGATAKIGDFLDPENFDVLKWQIDIVKEIVRNDHMSQTAIWLGETSSAYGGGAPYLSNRYISTFLWLDKLGMAAQNGLDVVIKQSIFQGHYALISKHYYPTPDWWVSILHKKLVGPKVVKCNLGHSSKLRLYCQCSQPNSSYNNMPSVTVFGVNLNNRRAKIRFEGTTPFNDEEAMKNLKVHAYILTTIERIDSRYIFLNEELLRLTVTGDVPELLPKVVVADPYVSMPAFSLGFWVVPITGNVPPYC